MKHIFLLLLILANVQPLLAQDSNCQSTQTSDDWSDRQYESALRQSMPIYRPNSWWGISVVLNVRITPSFSPEFGFTLIRHTNGELEGHADFPENESIKDQLRSLHQNSPDSTREEIVSHLKIRRIDATVASVNQLNQYLMQLEHSSIPPELKDVICTDGTTYEFQIDSPKSHRAFDVNCYSGDVPEVIQIAEEMRRVFMGFTAEDYKLLKALKNHDLTLATDLLKGGANPQAFTSEEEMPWSTAIGVGDANVVKLMLQMKPELASVADSLTQAAGLGESEIVNLLIQSGADLNEKSFGETPLMVVSELPEGALNDLGPGFGHYSEVTRELVSGGARVDEANCNGDTALMYAAVNDHAEIIQILIAAGANLNLVNQNGETALIRALKLKNTTAAEILIHAGTDIHIKDANGFTAVDIARENGLIGLFQTYGLTK